MKRKATIVIAEEEECTVHDKDQIQNVDNEDNNILKLQSTFREIGLTLEEITTFKEKGFVLLKKAFSPEYAKQGRDRLWTRMEENNIFKKDPNTWTERYGIPECYSSGSPWEQVLYTPRVVRSIDQLCGEGRWKEFGLGW